ncbi:hypothetical protein QR685DRAFT_429601, partial [Neurospora intermedia]
EGILYIFKTLDLAGKNGILNIQYFTTIALYFFVGEGTYRKREGAGRFSLLN